MSTAGLAQSGLASLANGPLDLETSEVSRSSSQASGRRRSIVDPEAVSVSTVTEKSTKNEKENLERLLKVFNGGNGLNFGKRVTINDPEKGPTEIRLTQRVKTFYVDKWPEIKDVKGGRDTVIIPNLPTKSARARNMIGGTPISRETAIALRKITLGSLVHSFSTDWRKSGLIFHDISSRMAYGLQTLKCGSRALVLCIQGFLLKHLFFAREYASPIVSTNALQPSEFERRKALSGAICEVLWRAGSGIRCCVCLLQEDAIFDTNWQYRVDGITEKVNLYEFKNFKDLELFVKRHVSHFEHENSNGCILLLYSLILSRTIQMVYDDMDVVMGDDVKEKLLTDSEECTINLINLLLTGRATKNLHNGNIIYDADGKLLPTPLRGIKERTQVGLLFWDKEEDPDERTETGSMLKTPKYPIWLTIVNGQYGLLFSLNLDLVSDWRVEHHFTLYYYTGLAHQMPSPLTIETLRVTKPEPHKSKYLINTRYLRRTRPKSGIRGRYQEEKIPALEQCIMTKWYGANIDWNGVFPYI